MKLCRRYSEITARLPPIPTNILQKIWNKAGKSGCQRLPINDLFATICPHCLALNCEPVKTLFPFIYRHLIGVLSGSRGINRTSRQRLGQPRHLATKSLRKKTRQTLGFYCMVPAWYPIAAHLISTRAAFRNLMITGTTGHARGPWACPRC